jgi:hypothetical protein
MLESLSGITLQYGKNLAATVRARHHDALLSHRSVTQCLSDSLKGAGRMTMMLPVEQ